MTADQVLVLEEAAKDLSEGVGFYEIQKAELGTYFFDSLISDIESLKLSAGTHPPSLRIPPHAGQSFSFCHLL